MKFLKHIKLNNIFNYVTVFLLIPFAVTLILLFAYTAYTTRIHQQGIFHTAADDIAENVEASLVGVMNETRMATYSNDFIYFCNSSSYESVDRYGQTVMAESQTGIFSYPEVVCMVLNNTSCGYYLPSFRSFDALFLRQEMEDIVGTLSAEGTAAVLTVREVNRLPYIFCSIADRYGSITTVVDPRKNPVYANYCSIYKENAAFDFSVSVPEDRRVFSKALPLVELNLFYSYPARYPLSGIQITLLAVILFLLVLIPLSLWALTRSISKPLNLISRSMEAITAGDFDQRIPPVNSIDDICAYAKGINMMLDAVKRSKEEEIDSCMAAVQAQLQYFQLQIRPHFYLNCMKNLNSLIDLKEYDKAQLLIYALSKYISHAFSDAKTFITIRDELEAIQNYVELCNSLAYEIHLEFKLSGECAGMNCIPMSLLTFVENSIKHTQTGSALTVSISIETFYAGNSEKKLKFTIRDSGGGFPEEVLEQQNHVDLKKPMYRRSHTGIFNVRYRLFLVFGDKAFLTLKNDGPSAVVEIVTPCEQSSERQLYEYTNRG